jgi:thymidylate synthase ThyX
MPTRQIYLLSPRRLSPETIAVAFAKTSRSPDSFRQISSELSAEKSARFHEKWVVGYGHASVAEHAVLHLAIENVSRLAVESIESNRLASYTEKSTRYQKWRTENFFVPPELGGNPRQEAYLQTCNLLFDTYASSLDPVRQLIERQDPRHPDESEEAYDRRIRSQYVDSCRFLLPAAALANLGMTANARVLENSIRKLLSHPLEEVRQIGTEIKRAALKMVPTLVKYAQAVPYLTETPQAFDQVVLKDSTSEANADWCRLVDYDPEGESKILACTLVRFSELTYGEAREAIQNASPAERGRLAALLLGKLDLHDTPLRELEHTSYTFDLILDQGAYAELKRHRMMTQTPQALTARLGYSVPRRMVEAGCEAAYHSAMQAAAERYEDLAAWNPQVAAYIVPNGFNRRVVFTLNLREVYAFCQLRSARAAHFSMRRVALRVAEEVRRVHPLLSQFMHLPDESWQAVEQQSFSQV